jgi:hypothetical protein
MGYKLSLAERERDGIKVSHQLLVLEGVLDRTVHGMACTPKFGLQVYTASNSRVSFPGARR